MSKLTELLERRNKLITELDTISKQRHILLVKYETAVKELETVAKEIEKCNKNK